MKNITVREIAKVCNGTYQGPDSNLDKCIGGVVIDSRKVEKDYIFVAIKGENVDGHDYAVKAMELGAICIISEKELQGVPYILVESSAKALQEAAKYYRQKLNVKVIGITGSVGKTSTKEMINAVASQKFMTHKTLGNYNNELGLPLTLFQVEDNIEVVVLEMGISDFNEMHLLADIARPDICVITNIGYCHLEALGDRDGVLKAKSEIFDFINEDAGIVLNGDDDKLAALKEIKGIVPMTFGLENKCADVTASDIVTDGLSGSSAVITFAGKRVLVNIPIPGIHMVSNACAGYIVGKMLGMIDDEIVKGIASLKPVDGRNNVIKTEKYIVIDDCYNANPVSMKASVDVLSGATKGRNVAILGDMFELGETEKELHAEVGKHIVGKHIDTLVCVGKLAKNIYDEASKDEHINCIYFEEKKDMQEKLFEIVKEGDNILVKASHGMGFTEVVKELTR